MWQKQTKTQVVTALIAAGLWACPCQTAFAQGVQVYSVPATSNPLFGGTTADERAIRFPLDPEGSGDDSNLWNDSIDATTPQLIPVDAGATLHITATADWSHYEGDHYGAGGLTGTTASTREVYDVWGSGLNNGTLGEVVGMFGPPDLGNLPPRLDAAVDDVTTPEVGQLFPIGESIVVIVPAEAEWVAFGLHDEYECNNNQGFAAITITVEPSEITTWLIPPANPDDLPPEMEFDSDKNMLKVWKSPPEGETWSFRITADGVTIDFKENTFTSSTGGTFIDFGGKSGGTAEHFTAEGYDVVIDGDYAQDATIHHFSARANKDAITFNYGDGLYVHHADTWQGSTVKESQNVLIDHTANWTGTRPGISFEGGEGYSVSHSDIWTDLEPGLSFDGGRGHSVSDTDVWGRAGVLVRDSIATTVSKTNVHEAAGDALTFEGVAGLVVDGLTVDGSGPSARGIVISSPFSYPVDVPPNLIQDVKIDLQNGQAFIEQGSEGPLSFTDFLDFKLDGSANYVFYINLGQDNLFSGFDIDKVDDPKVYLGPEVEGTFFDDFKGDFTLEPDDAP